jgi:glutathione S-transferase
MKIYGQAKTRSLRATWAAEEAGLEYDYQRVDLSAGEGRADSYLKINPGGKVPALVDGDLVLTESAAILNYIGALCPQSGLLPTDIKQRARYDQWCFFAMTELEQPLWTLSKHSFVLPTDLRVASLRPAIEWEFSRALDVLADGLGEQAYILGQGFTAADILLGHILIWARGVRMDLRHDNLRSYLKRVRGRSALESAIRRESEA